jgi:hypothetical protein
LAKPKIEVDSDMMRKIVDARISNQNSRDIAASIGVSHTFIQKILRQNDFKEEVISAIRRRLTPFAGEMVDCLMEQVREGNVQAITQGFKILGALEHEPVQNKQQQGITVILPGAAPSPKEIRDIPSTVEDSTGEDNAPS